MPDLAWDRPFFWMSFPLGLRSDFETRVKVQAGAASKWAL
jgi:hypothetical protein